MTNQSRAEQMVSCAFYFDCFGCSGWKKRKTDCVVLSLFLRRLSKHVRVEFPHLVPSIGHQFVGPKFGVQGVWWVYRLVTLRLWMRAGSPR